MDPCEHALSTNLTPKFIASYYVRQCDVYFNSLEGKFQFFKPNYSRKICRWEWPNNALLTGYGRTTMYNVDSILRTYPCICVEREHRYFSLQPYARSIVTFYYGDDILLRKKPIRMYFEFTFNDQGEITFIESWLAKQGEQLPLFRHDGWPTGEFYRLSTIVPGLGNKNGYIDINSAVMYISGTSDLNVAELRNRAFEYQEIRQQRRTIQSKIEDIINGRARFIGDHARYRPMKKTTLYPRIFPSHSGDQYLDSNTRAGDTSMMMPPPRPGSSDQSACTERVI